jgi:hypothetical protein
MYPRYLHLRERLAAEDVITHTNDSHGAFVLRSGGSGHEQHALVDSYGWWFPFYGTGFQCIRTLQRRSQPVVFFGFGGPRQ